MLGAHGHSDWLDLSEHLVHFAKGTDEQGYQTLLSILGGRVLRRGPFPFGMAKGVAAIAETQRAVCFSETPLGFLQRLVERRGTRYGIGFGKRSILDRGGAPLWHTEFGTPQHAAIQRLVDEGIARGPIPSDPIWKLTPYVDAPSGPTAPYKYDFRWEREWRLTDDLAFTEDEVAFLLIPESLHAAARSFFVAHKAANTGPGYFCPYFDPTWSLERIKDALGK